MSGWPSRRVVDPKPVMRGLAREQQGSNMDDLASAWNSMGRAKSVLRRAEHHIHEASRPAAEGLAPTVQADHRVAVDRVPSYTSVETVHSAGAIVDKYGRTPYLKTREQKARKVSRLEDKYQDKTTEDILARKRSPLREPNCQWEPAEREYTKRPHDGSTAVPHKSSSRSASNQFDTTDPQALLETERHFINDISSTVPRTDYEAYKFDSQRESASRRLAHVSVTVPNAKPRPVTSGTFEPAKTYPYSSSQDRHPQMNSHGAASNLGSSVNSTFTVNSSQKRLKKSLKDVPVDQNNDALEKLREKIRQQRNKHPSKDSPGALNGDGVGTSREEMETLLKKSHHHEEDPVIPKQPTVYENGHASAPIVRKVARAPPVPHYKGFNEVDNRYHPPPVDPKTRRVAKEAKKKRKIKRDGGVYEVEQDIAKDPSPDKQKQAKAARVVAPAKKPSKQDRQSEVISTHSWRAGQKAILRELGPSRLPKMGSSPPTTDKNINLAAVEEKEEPKPAATKPTSSLSQEARGVLNDLHSDSEGDGEAEKAKEDDGGITHHRSRPISKRKRPTKTEALAEEKMKSRHYDSDDVRKYIAQQKADRKKRLSEQKEAQKQAHEKKQQQLRELYEKTKASARSRSRSRSKKRTEDEEEGGEQAGGSDKENQALSDLSSSDGSTVTAGSAGSEKPDSLAKEDGVDKLVNKYAGSAGPTKQLTHEATKDSGIALTADDIINKYLSGQTADGIIERYSQQAQAIKSAYNASEDTRPMTSLPSASRAPVERDPLGYPRRPYSTGTTAGGAAVTSEYRERINRIHALRNTAELLQNRIHREATRIHNIDKVPDAVPDEAEKWAYRTDAEEGNYISKYSRMTAAQDYKVFDKDLPGVGGLNKAAYDLQEEHKENAAAAKIQALYRGHTVRQALDWNPAKDEESDFSVYSLDTNTTMSDDGGAAESADKIASTLAGYDYHAGTAYSQPPFREVFRASATEPAGSEGGGFGAGGKPLRPVKPTYQWKDPQADPYSIINVYARRSRQQARDLSGQPGYAVNSHTARVAGAAASGALRDSAPTLASSAASDGSEHSYSDDFSQSQHTENKSASAAVSGRSKNLSSHHIRSPTSARSAAHSHASAGVSGRSRATENHHTASRRTSQHASQRGASQRSSHKSQKQESKSQRLASSQQEVTYEETEDDDTLNATLTPSLGSDEDVDSNHEVSLVPSPHQKSVSVRDVEDVSQLSVSSLGEEEVPYDPLGRPSYTTGYSVGRMSPGSLERRMAAELHLLESMEVSMQQVTDVERTRAVSMAQQESVSLAQILKSRQQLHQQEMTSLQLKATQETLDAQRQLEEARRRAAEAAQNAAAAISQVRTEATASMQGSSEILIKTQAEAAKATAEAARQLAEARLSLHPATTDTPSMVAAAASAAVSTAMRHVYHYPSQQLGVDFSHYEKATQYSQRSQSQVSDISKTDVSRSDVSRTDASYESESFQSSYTQSPNEPVKKTDIKKSKKHVSASSEVHTASDLSNAKSAASVKTDSVATATDMSPASKKQGSSIRTESGAAGALSPRSKADSIPEDMGSEKGDYSLEFDTSITEEEMEKSLRDVLPAETHRKKLKRQPSQSELGYSSDEQSQSFSVDAQFPPMPASMGGNARRLSFEEESFTKFTVEMVRQYMREEETRAQHQSALLKLRQRALKEKTRAELAWLEQQKQHLRDKGADDVYPQIKKRRRGLLLRLQQEQAEIKRLQEASKAASKERQFLLKQSQEIARLRQSTQQVLRKMRQRHREYQLSSSPTLESSSVSQVREKMKRKAPSDEQTGDAPTEDDTSIRMEDEAYDTSRSPSPNKDVDMSMEQSKTTSATDIAQKLKKMKLDGKYLTVREQKLRHRRKQVEELLAWKAQLDEEEAAIKRMERDALSVFHRGRAGEAEKGPPKKMMANHTKEMSKSVDKDKALSFTETQDVSRSTKLTSKKDSKVSKDATTPRTPRTPRTDTIAEETLASEIASEMSIDEDLSISGSTTGTTERKKTGSISESIATDVRTRTSVPEEISQSSITDVASTDRSKKRTPEAGEETVTSANDEYYNETFESEASQTATRTQTVSQSQPSKPAQNKPAEAVSPVKGVAKSPTKSPAKSPFTSPVRKTSESESEDSYSVAETTSDQSDVEGRIRTLTEELKRRKNEAEKLKKEQKKKQKEKLRAQEDSLKKQIEAYDSYITQVKDGFDGESEEADQVRPQIKQPSESKRLNKHSPEHTSSTSPEEKRLSSDSLSESYDSPSKRKSTSSDQESTPEREKSEILEDIPEEVSAANTDESGSQRLVLDEKVQSVHLSLKNDKTEDETSYSEDFTSHTAPRSGQLSRKSSPEEDVPEEASLHTAQSESEKSGLKTQDKSELKLDLEKSEAKQEESKKSERREKLSARSDSVKSIASDFSEDFETESDRSQSDDSRTETYSQKTDTGSRTSQSASKADESKSYNKDDSRSSATTESRQKTEENKKTREEASVDTDEDVSEHLSEDEQDTPSPVALDFSKDVVAVPSTAAPEPTIELSTLSQEEQEDVLADFHIGDRVLVGGVQPGTLRFKGPVAFTTGHWGGVELDQPEGRHDGSKDGVDYFDCKLNHGIFAPPEKLSHLPRDEDSESDASQHTLTDAKSVADESIAEDISVATADSELERVISSAAAAVEEFGEQGAAPSPVDDTLGSEPNSPRGPPEEVADEDLFQDENQEKQGKALDLTAQNLLNESISQMLDIYQKKVSSPTKTDFIIQPEEELPATDESKPDPVEDTTPATIPDTPVTPEPIERQERDDTPFKFGKDDFPEDDIFQTRVIMAPQNFPDLSPAKPNFMDEGDSQDDLDKLYDELGALTGDSDEWFDDDFGLGIKQKSPPPYQDNKKNAIAELRLDLQKVIQEPFFAIPHKKEQLVPLADNAVSVFWEKRRYGEPWTDVEPPSSYYGSEDHDGDMEGRSKKAYKKLVFDLSGDILRDVYQEEEQVEPAPWMKSKRVRKKYYRGLSPPRTQDDVAPIVQTQVCSLVGANKDADRKKRVNKWSCRKKRDHVDKVLLQELAEEEPDWVDYNDDELTVKMQLVDSIFDALLTETAQALEEAAKRKANK